MGWQGEVAVVPGLGAINPGALRPTPRASDKVGGISLFYYLRLFFVLKKNEDDKIDVQWSAKSPLKPVPPKIPVFYESSLSEYPVFKWLSLFSCD
jgi:hypothetical protein